MQRVLVTGASGFVGRALIERLLRDGVFVPRAVSRSDRSWPFGAEAVRIDDLALDTDWREAFAPGAGGDAPSAVVHLAARVHTMDDNSTDPLTEFRKVNTLGTERLARMAAAAGVKRFVYVSTIKVNGESTEHDPQRRSLAFSEKDVPYPRDPYGESKWEAEQTLLRVSDETGMEIVVVRPPLVYGPEVRANFLRLLHWVDKGIPLPLASVDNRRSLVALDNLVDFLMLCIEHPAAAGETFLVADGEDLSTPELIRRIAAHMGRPARLIPLPLGLIRLAGRLSGKEAMVDRLCGSLRVDNSNALQVLGWKPPVSVDEGLSKTVAWYLKDKEGRNA